MSREASTSRLQPYPEDAQAVIDSLVAQREKHERIIRALWDEVADIPGCAGSFMRVFSETAPESAALLQQVIR